MSYVEKNISDVENFTSDIIFTFAIFCKPESYEANRGLRQEFVNQVIAIWRSRSGFS